MIHVVSKYTLGETIYLVAYTRNRSTEELENATNVTYYITDPEGTAKVTNTEMTNTDTGVYEGYHTTATTDPAGIWHYKVVAYDSTLTTIVDGEVEVRDWLK